MSVFEVGMLVSFGLAWPANIYKSYKSRSIEGKSVKFLYIILIGYVFGILHKIVYNYDFVIYLYMLNFLMVFTDIVLFYKNKKLKNKRY